MPVRPPSDSATATTPAPPPPPPPHPPPPRSHLNSSSFASYHDSPALAIFALLLAFRIVNALTLRTFFQPDEYFQSLEPAWQLAFGAGSNAWITWEWRSHLRSSLHPALFAAVYQVAAKLATMCALSLPAEAALFIAAPKIAQAVFAALLDLYTWKLAEKLVLSVCSPWQWFCSTRTLSNCLETAITSIAVYYWPWHWPGAAGGTEARDGKQKSKNHADRDLPGSSFQLRLSLVLAAFACILRPTNILIWAGISLPTLWQASSRRRTTLAREIFFCGSAVLACSVLSDRAYYGVWTLPPLRFLYFNIAQSLAVFYGRNRPDYYLTEGLPLLLTTALPFALVGLWQALASKTVQAARSPSDQDSTSVAPKASSRIVNRLAWTSVFMTFALSTISHKEVRFLYPLLPFLHVLAARPIVSFLNPWTVSRRAILVLLLTINLIIAGYTSQVHQRGVIDVLDYLRHKHEAQSQTPNTNASTTVGFLMPCHSTPWRSHLVHSGIDAWALTCEPPLDVPLSERHTYLDEADRFYKDPGPVAWLQQNMGSVDEGLRKNFRSGNIDLESEGEGEGEQGGKRKWPQNVVFFAQLEPVIKEVLGNSRYGECWRGFNTQFHDDARRVGDMVVWCRE